MESIKILGVNDPAVGAYKQDRFLDNLSKKFGIEIEMDIIDFADYYERLMEAFREGSYDIVMVAGHLWLSNFIAKGYLEPLNMIGNITIDNDILSNIRREMYIGDDLYLIPSFCDGHILTYRRDDLEKILPEAISINDMVQMVKDGLDKGRRFPIVLKAHPSEIFLDTLPYIRAMGCNYFDDNGLPTFNNSECTRGIEMYLEMLANAPVDAMDYDNDRVKGAIQRGDTSLAITWGGQLGAVMNDDCKEKEDIGFSMLEESWNVTWAFGINKTSPNHRQALMVIQELMSQEIDRSVGRISGNPTRKSNFEIDKELYPWYGVTMDMIESAKPLPSFDRLPDCISIVSGYLTRMAKGDIEVVDGLSRAEREILDIYRCEELST